MRPCCVISIRTTRNAQPRESVTPAVNVPYWYRPHRSSMKLPVLFLHGIGVGFPLNSVDMSNIGTDRLIPVHAFFQRTYCVASGYWNFGN